MKRSFALILGIFGFGLGVLVATFLSASVPAQNPQAFCRPSAPEQLANGPKVLFWGNSLAFDHNWRLRRSVPVNCARQGMTAKAALEVIHTLPAIEFDAIVVVFGTVELLRDIKSVDQFSAAISTNIAQLSSAYDGSKIVVVGVPEGPLDVWRYNSDVPASAMNDVLRQIDGVDYIDTTQVLSDLPWDMQTYDGIHLTAESYAILERALIERIN